MLLLELLLFTVSVALGTCLGHALYHHYPLILKRGKEALRALRSGRNAE
jgi:hypothetical protein